MKLSYTTLATPGYSCRQSIEAARTYGYQGIDLRLSNQGELTVRSTDQDIHYINQLLSEHDIAASSLLLYNPGVDRSELSWRELETYLLRGLELADAIHAQSVRMFCSLPTTVEANWYRDRTTELLQRVVDQDKSGVAIHLQNHRSHATVARLVKLLEMTNHPRIGMLLSPDHCLRLEEEVFDQLDQLEPYVKQLYVADVIASGGQFPDVLPGYGEVPYERILQHYDQARFDGWVSFKWERMHHIHLESPEVSLPHFISYMNRVQHV
ncbi:sugar phosphate isomerase/epimerase family protein [Paenibacillus sp. GCM10023252]|uniref:sugar phosphate isomerase/epimerase family protein n=1 Tax=Paenibacillus sp. GCM10023252 TaxID=3252649 RepID=UPI00361981D2